MNLKPDKQAAIYIAALLIIISGLLGIGFFKFFFFVLPWWITLELLMLFALVPCFYIFRFLPDRGYGISRILCLYFIVYLTWLGGSLKFFSYSRAVLLVFLILCGAISAYFFFTKQKVRNDLLGFFKANKSYIILAELLFFFGFLLFVNIRSYCPEITFEVSRHAAEKFGNFEVLNSIFRTKFFPPEDAWFSGNPLNYYYYGHLLWASMGIMSGYASQYTFNIALATLFALTFLGAFSLGYNVSRRIGIALLAAFSTAVFGNLLAALEFFSGFKHLPNLDYIFHSGFFWSASRVIRGTITEFPAFTALLGDLHAHHSGLLSILLGLTVTLHVFLWIKQVWLQPSRKLDIVQVSFILFPVALSFGWLIGSAYPTNAWDSVTLVSLYTIVLWYLTFYLVKSAEMPTITMFPISAFFTGVMLVCMFIFFFPFLHNFISPLPMEIKPKLAFWKTEIKQFPIAVLQPKNRTAFIEYFDHFGLLLLPVYVWLCSEIKRHLFTSLQKAIFYSGLFLFLIIFSCNYFLRMLPGFLLFILIVSIILFFRTALSEQKRRWFYLMLAAGTFISIFVEFFFFDDRYSGDLERYNTPFKFFNHVWLMYAIISAWCWMNIFNAAHGMRPLIKRVVILAIVVLLSMIYPIGGTIERTSRFFLRSGAVERRPERILDGIAYLGQLPDFRDDYKVIMWARANIPDKPVVLENVGGPYTAYSRFATNTGIPTLLGWGHHVAQWRGDRFYTDKVGEFRNIGRREQSVRQIYSAPNLESVKDIIQTYKIQYIFVGSLERKDFSAENLKKFDRLEKTFTANQSVLFRIPSDF